MTDTQPVRVPKGLEYGERQRLEEAQKVVPLPQQPGIRAAQRRDVPPGSLTSLTAPSQRPDEPVTAGLPIGEGPGPEALVGMPQGDDTLAVIKVVYQRFRNEDLRRFIERAERGAFT